MRFLFWFNLYFTQILRKTKKSSARSCTRRLWSGLVDIHWMNIWSFNITTAWFNYYSFFFVVVRTDFYIVVDVHSFQTLYLNWSFLVHSHIAQKHWINSIFHDLKWCAKHIIVKIRNIHERFIRVLKIQNDLLIIE